MGGWRTASICRRYNITSESDLIAASEKIEASRQVSTPADKTSTKTDTSALAPISRPMKMHLSGLKRMAGTTRLELATSAVTGQRSNQLNYVPAEGKSSHGGH